MRPKEGGRVASDVAAGGVVTVAVGVEVGEGVSVDVAAGVGVGVWLDDGAGESAGVGDEDDMAAGEGNGVDVLVSEGTGDIGGDGAWRFDVAVATATTVGADGPPFIHHRTTAQPPMASRKRRSIAPISK